MQQPARPGLGLRPPKPPLAPVPTWRHCAGTGGSALIIGSAAGVAAMGMEDISFTWYLRRISVWAVLGYLAGAMVYVVQNALS